MQRSKCSPLSTAVADPILPKSTMPSLPLIVLSSYSASHQLDRPWNYMSISLIRNKQMKVIAGHHVIQDN